VLRRAERGRRRRGACACASPSVRSFVHVYATGDACEPECVSALCGGPGARWLLHAYAYTRTRRVSCV